MSRSRVCCCSAIVIGLLFCLAVAVPAAYSQETTGGIKGYVKDKSGATITKAEVELTSTALLASRKGETDSSGYFYFQLLPPGDYTVTVTANGFRGYKQSGIGIS